MSPEPGWPPRVGDLLPHRAAAWGVRTKLAGYSLNHDHKHGGPKARGFLQILGITIDDIDYLEATILDAAQSTPIRAVHPNPPHGIRCDLDVQVHGLHGKSDRTVRVRTGWLLPDADSPPRLVSAYPKP